MNKTITIKEHILNYAKNERYFNINDLRNYFNDKKIDYKNDTLKKYLYLLKTENVIYGAGRGWYSTIKHDFVLDRKPVEEIGALIKDKFPLLDFSCWSTEQIKGFFHHHFRKLKDSTKPKLAVLTRRGHITFNLKQSHFYTFFHIQWMRNEYPHFDRP